MTNLNDAKRTDPLYILSFLLILLYFVMLALVYKAQPIKGATVCEESWSESIALEDGNVLSPTYQRSYLIPHSGSYRYQIEWDVLDPAFLVGVVGKDENGNTLFAFTAAQITYANTGNLTGGQLTLAYHILDSENAYREFANAYHLFSTQDELDAMIQQIGYDSFPKNGEWTLRQAVTIHEMKTPPIVFFYAYMLIGLVTAASVLLLYSQDRTPSETLQGRISSIGIRYTSMVVIVVFVQSSIITLLSLFAQGIVRSLGANLSFLMMILGVDIIAVPMTYLLCKKIPVQPIPKRKLGLGNLLLFLLMSAGLCGSCMIIGNFTHSMLTLPFNSHSSVVGDLVMNSGFPMRVLTLGLLAPIFEELLFRKLLIDHLNKYGEFIAVLASGLMFGIFHGNFSQFFYATALGLLWGFVYIRTGNILYTIFLHMAINASNSAITVYLLGKFYEYVANPNDPSAIMNAIYSSEEAALYIALYGAWSILLTVLCIVGFLIVLVFFCTGRFRLRVAEGEASHKEILKEMIRDKYMWLFYLACIGLFLMNYLPAILSYVLS